MFEDWDWQKLAVDTVIFAAEHPWQFVYYVLLCLSPLFLISSILAWKLAKQIEQKEKEKKKKARREANIRKSRNTNKEKEKTSAREKQE
ncbi:small integral membrane protein 15-like [Tubulanus polymorphus]|uniref:small integral membrane protein 15-like n=1 Tax=Tubulanus polymorphus TaxID=672921 RepID=UPI003DA4737F